MGIFELFGILTFLYYTITVILLTILDSNIELFFKEKFGKPISSLERKVIWITGASSGIGKHLAITLAQHCKNVKLCLSARRINELENVKKECLAISKYLKSEDILVLQMDMLNIDQHEEHFQTVLKYFNGHLDILVNNAGRTQRAYWENIDIDVDRDLFELNVFSVLNLSRIYVRYIEEHSLKGHLVVTSSLAGLIQIPFSPSYVGAKTAINAYFSALKTEKPHIDVTIFCPGPTFSELLLHAFTNSKDKFYCRPMQPNDTRLTLEKCTFQMAIAIANKLSLCYNGPYPWVIITYIWNYCPNIRNIFIKIFGHKGFIKIRDSKETNEFE